MPNYASIAALASDLSDEAPFTGAFVGVGPAVSGGDDTTAIQARLDAANPGDTVMLRPGASYSIGGTIFVPSGVTLDLNGSTLAATASATFDDVATGMTLTNPATIKPVVALTGTSEARISGAVLRNGTIDGNGANQPDTASYCNVAVIYADDCRVENITSFDARPGLTITGTQRAFCLLVCQALRTHIVGGDYRNAGYDTVGIREGAYDTTLDRVKAYESPKGAVQVTAGASRISFTDCTLDNTDGTTAASHALFIHGGTQIVFKGGFLTADLGACVNIFSDDPSGDAEDVIVDGAVCRHVATGAGTNAVYRLETEYAHRLSFINSTVYKAATSGQIVLATSPGGVTRLTVANLKGQTLSNSTAVALTNVSDFTISDLDIKTPGTVTNPFMALTGCSRGWVENCRVDTESVAFNLLTTCDAITLSRNTVIAAFDSVDIADTCTNIDVLDNDFRGVTSTDKLRLYRAASGKVRNNRGADYDYALRSGRYYRVPNASLTASIPTAGSLRVMPYYIGQPVTLSRIAAEVTVAGDSTSTHRLGIYADDGTFRPGALVIDAGTIDGETVGMQEITVDVDLKPGWYWFGGVNQDVTTTGPTIRQINPAGRMPDVDHSTTLPAGSATAFCGFFQASVTGALPATFTPTHLGVAATSVVVKVA